MDRSSLPRHVLSCPAVAVICLNSDSSGGRCNVQCKRYELAEHQAGCVMRLFLCPQGCECELTVSQLAAHNCVAFLKLEINSLKTDCLKHDSAIANTNIKHDCAIAALTSANQVLAGALRITFVC